MPNLIPSKKFVSDIDAFRSNAPLRKKLAKTLNFLASNPRHPGLNIERIINDPTAWSIRVDRAALTMTTCISPHAESLPARQCTACPVSEARVSARSCAREYFLDGAKKRTSSSQFQTFSVLHVSH